MGKSVWMAWVVAFCGVIIIGGSGLAVSVRAEEQEAAEGTLTAGCKTAYFMMLDLVGGYKDKTGTTIIPKRTGNKVAAKMLEAGEIKFAFTCEPHSALVKNFELDSSKVGNWVTKRVAMDPIVVVVNRNNPVSNLTRAQLTDVYSGKITNWRNVGGPDEEIKITYQDDSLQSGVLVVFSEQTVGSVGGKLQPLAETAVRFPGPNKRGAFVSQNLGGTTFMGLSAYQERYGKLLNIDGAAPTRENIVNGSYPIAGTYYLVYDKADTELADQFLEYLSSKDGQQVLNRNFVSVVD